MVLVAVCCLGLLTPALASAKGNKHKGGKVDKQQKAAAAALLSKYDANANGKLDADEITKIQSDYAAGNASDAQVFDTNGDKKLDDSEIALLERAAKMSGKHKKK